MGYDVSVVLIGGVVLHDSSKDESTDELYLLFRRLFQQLDKIKDEDIEDEMYSVLRSEETTKGYIISNKGVKTPFALRSSTHGDEKSIWSIVLHCEEMQVMRGHEKWPKEISRPTPAEIAEFNAFLQEKGIPGQYKEYFTLEGSW